MGIVDLARAQVQRSGHRRVDRIDLDIGTLSGVELDALDFAWQSAVRRTVLQDAERHINRIPGKARCLDCGAVFPVQALYEPCPRCGEYLTELLQGKELRVRSLVVSGGTKEAGKEAVPK